MPMHINRTRRIAEITSEQSFSSAQFRSNAGIWLYSQQLCRSPTAKSPAVRLGKIGVVFIQPVKENREVESHGNGHDFNIINSKAIYLVYPDRVPATTETSDNLHYLMNIFAHDDKCFSSSPLVGIAWQKLCFVDPYPMIFLGHNTSYRFINELSF